MGESVFIEAGVLHEIALDAHQRCQPDPPRDRHDLAALTAITFSAFSLEAFINEVGSIASTASVQKVNPPAVATFGSAWTEVEESQGSLELKYMLARFVFAGAFYARGEAPFQDFANLLRVRNGLVHLKPKDRVIFREIPPDVWGDIERLKKDLEREPFARLEKAQILEKLPNAIIRPAPLDAHTSWTVRISTKTAARWACNVAADMIQSVLNFVPVCPFKNGLRVLYGDRFRRIP